jgi:hypothetical protein
MAATTTVQSQGGSDSSVQTAGARRATTTETQPTRTTRTQEPKQVTATVQAPVTTRQQQFEAVGCILTFELELEVTPPPQKLPA